MRQGKGLTRRPFPCNPIRKAATYRPENKITGICLNRTSGGRMYLPWANQVFLAFFAFNGINNLRVFSVAFSSIPTAPGVLVLFV